METGYHAKVCNVHLIHAGDDVHLIRKIKAGVEDELQLQGEVKMKLKFREKDNVAKELLRLMEKLDEDHEDRAVIIISHRFCELMKNNSQSSQAFEDAITKDLDRPEDEHRFALVWCEDSDLTASIPLFQEAFSEDFVRYLSQDREGLVRFRRSMLEDYMPKAVEEMLKRWLGPAAHLGDPNMEVPTKIDIADIETVRIVHGGAKQAVREIGTELEEGFQLEDTIKYKLYNRVSEDKIPDIIVTEVQNLKEKDGPNALGVVVWCPKFLATMKDSRCKEHFEDLLSTLDQQKLVQLCYGVNGYEVKKYFPKLSVMNFLGIVDNPDDGTVEVTGLTQRILNDLDQPKRTAQNQGARCMDDLSPPAQPKPDDRPPSSIEHQMSEISEPSALASQSSQRPQPIQLQQQQPIPLMQPSVGLVGNPSNQTQQGGRIVLPNGGSLSMNSAWYASSESSGRMPAQPSQNSSVEDQQPKFVANNGHSYQGLPSCPTVDPQSQELMIANGLGNHSLGSYNPSDSSGSTNNVQMRTNSAPRGLHGQVTSLGASSHEARFLANGEHSMPFQSFPSHSFGSNEPVLNSTTGQSISSRYPSSIMNTSFPQAPGSIQSSGASSLPPGTNRWAPSDCQSTEMTSSGLSLRNMEAPQSRPSTNGNLLPHHLEDSLERRAALKIPRREEVADISGIGSSDYQGFQSGFMPSHTSYNNLSQGGASVQRATPSMSNNAASTNTVPSASSVSTASQANQFSLPGLASNVSNQSSNGRGPQFVQCSADSGEGTFANNQPSNDAFKQQDYGEIGPGRNLPNQEIGPQFMSLPAAGQRLGNENERMNSSPASLQQTARTISDEPSDPKDHLIKDMNYRCRDHLRIMLDPETNTGSDWKVFASAFDMKFSLMRYLQHKSSSQTHELLNWLMENKPDVTCGKFKEVARDHQRLDVVRMMNKYHY